MYICEAGISLWLTAPADYIPLSHIIRTGIQCHDLGGLRILCGNDNNGDRSHITDVIGSSQCLLPSLCHPVPHPAAEAGSPVHAVILVTVLLPVTATIFKPSPARRELIVSITPVLLLYTATLFSMLHTLHLSYRKRPLRLIYVYRILSMHIFCNIIIKIL